VDNGGLNWVSYFIVVLSCLILKTPADLPKAADRLQSGEQLDLGSKSSSLKKYLIPLFLLLPALMSSQGTYFFSKPSQNSKPSRLCVNCKEGPA
jgi:hypothetical protein